MALYLFNRLDQKYVIVACLTGALVYCIRYVDINSRLNTHKLPNQRVVVNLTECDQLMRGRFRRMMNGTKHCQKLHFRSPGSGKTALVSFPGSGNTWLRHLIEEATGLFTGSVSSHDVTLKQTFPGEGIVNGSVVVVKTHRSSKRLISNHPQVILLVRNPFRASMAEYARQRTKNNHTGLVSPTFEWTQSWSEFYMRNIREWFEYHEAWLTRTKPTLVVTYENLKKDPIHEMKRIIKFLKLKTSDDILNCMAYNSEGQYHRKSIPIAPNAFNGGMVSTTIKYLGIINKGMKEKYGVTIDGTTPTNRTG